MCIRDRRNAQYTLSSAFFQVLFSSLISRIKIFNCLYHLRRAWLLKTTAFIWWSPDIYFNICTTFENNSRKFSILLLNVIISVKCTNLISTMINVELTFKSVSYTHLDVYKRQLVQFTNNFLINYHSVL